MIFKKLQNINEDFDFGSVEIESSAASSYRQTPEMVRVQTNKNVDPIMVLNGLFKCKTPFRSAKYSYDDPRAGKVYASHDFLHPQYHPSNDQPYHYHNVDSYWRLRPRDEQMLNHAGFKKVRASYKGLHIKAAEDWAFALLSMYCPHCDEFEIGINSDSYFNFEYYISPDNGLVLVTYFNFKCDNYFNEAIYETPAVVIMYTGDVIYEVNNITKKVVKGGKDDANNFQRQIGFLDAILQRDNLGLERHNLRACQPVVLPNGNLIYIVNRPAPHMSIDGKIVDTFTLQRTSVKNYLDPSQIAYSKNIIAQMFHTLASRVCRIIKPMIFKYVQKPEESVVSGATTENKLWILYNITDKKVLAKLVGPEIAAKFNDNTTYSLKGSNAGKHFPLYQFFFITNTGMKYYNAVMDKSMTLSAIKLGNILK